MTTQAAPRRRAAPKGYEKKNTDVKGYWTEDEPIHFIPRGVKLLDGNIDSDKPTAIIVGELVERAILSVKDEDPFEGNVGDIVGVWYKPGMRDIALCSGLKVWLDKDLDENDVQRTKKMKKGNPMKLYTVTSSPGKPARIPITEDTRKDSRHKATAFDDPNLRPIRAQSKPEVQEEEYDGYEGEEG